MKRVLIVDDEPQLLKTLEQDLKQLQPDWQIELAERGEESLALLAKSTFDAVVSDFAMPGMDGMEFLARVAKSHPSVVRIILSGQADWKTSVHSLHVAHQYLTKPCDSRQLAGAIERSLALRDRLTDERLKRLVSEIPAIPSPPRLYLELLEVLRTREPSTAKIGQIVAQDPAMCGKLLQLANSAFFGLPSRITSPTEAVFYLGLETIKALVLSLQIFALFERVKVKEFSYTDLWDHSLAAGLLAQRIATFHQAAGPVIELAFTAGLLHDVGKLLLVTGVPHRYQKALVLQQKKQWSNWQAEREAFATTHAEVGAYLLGLWGLPNDLVEAVAFHHEPGQSPCQEFGPLTAAHAANAFARAKPGEPTSAITGLDMAYLDRVGVREQLDAWRALGAGPTPSSSTASESSPGKEL
jgi:putative nucleotidyltransferase with HDIG domain